MKTTTALTVIAKAQQFRNKEISHTFYAITNSGSALKTESLQQNLNALQQQLFQADKNMTFLFVGNNVSAFLET